MKKVGFWWKSSIFKLFCMCLSLVTLLVLCVLSAKDDETVSSTSETVSQGSVTETEKPLELYAQSAVLLDADSGRVLYSKNGEEILPMASTTKILTCILALEKGNLEDKVLVSSRAAGMPKVKLYVREGETYQLKDLLYSLMLESHNDSAVAIAEHIGGSVEGFAGLMNEKAREIGCESSCFLTPNGLDAVKADTGEFHSTTASDLARIMAYCIGKSKKSEEFLQITQTQDYAFTNSAGRSFSCHNHNALLGMMDGALSGKTGFTNQAGYCYVGAAKKDERTFVVALLACGWPSHKTYKWADCKTLFHYGFENFQYRDVFEKPELKPIPVEEGIAEEKDPFHQAYVRVQMKEEVSELPLLLKESDKVEVRCLLPRSLIAPVKKGKEIGTIVYTLNTEPVKVYPIVTAESVEKQDIAWVVKFIFDRFFL